MHYFTALILVMITARVLSGSWGKAMVLPWVIVTAPMLMGAGLANLDLMPSIISPWSLKTHATVLAGTIALAVGSFTVRNIRGPLVVRAKDVSWNERTLLHVLVSVTIIAFIANMTEFLIAGQIPLFAADPDHARLIASKNGFIHVFGVLSGQIVPIASLVLLTGEGLQSKTRRILKILIAVNLVLLVLWVARGMLIYPILTVVAMNYILKQSSFTLKKVLILSLVLLVIVSGVKYMRDVTRFGRNLSVTQDQKNSSELVHNMLENGSILYLTIALNYEILNQYVAAVPLLAPHSHGRIIGSNLLVYIPGTGRPYTELELQNTILKKNEHDLGLTSTFFGIPYLEFGLPGVLIAGFAVGFLYRTVWRRMFEKGTPWSIYLYGYLISIAVFIPYVFLFSQVSFTWFVLTSYPIVFLCSCRAKGASLYHQKSRIEFERLPAGR